MWQIKNPEIKPAILDFGSSGQGRFQVSQLVLSGLLIILLALSSVVRAQESQSQTLAIDQKQTTLQPRVEQPPIEPDDKHDAKLAVY